MRTTVSLDSISALVEGRHANPFDVLGPHEVENGGRSARAVRAYLPNSQQVWLIDQAQNTSRPMRRIHPSGLYEAVGPVDERAANQPYQFRVTQRSGQTIIMHDPYAFKPLLTDYDLYLFGEGTHSRAYDKLGAKLRTVDGVTGVNFAFGLRMRRAYRSLAISTFGMVAATACASTSRAEFGSFSFRH